MRPVFALALVLALALPLAGCTNPEYAREPAPEGCPESDTTAPVSRPEGSPTPPAGAEAPDCPDEERA
jgi:hypothetical protein